MPAEDSREQQPDGQKPQRPSYRYKSAPAAGIAAFINTYKNEQKANRQQDRREDRVHKWIEILTLTFVVLTTVGIFIQAFIFYNTDKTTKEALIDVQRAFITSYEVRITPSIEDNRIVSWAITPILENAGNTSATRVRTKIMRLYFSPLWGMAKIPTNLIAGAENPDMNDIEFGGLPESSITLAPHAKIDIAEYVLTEQAADMLRYGTLESFVYGESEYYDVFDNRHRIKFCCRLIGRSERIGSVGSMDDTTVGAASNIGDIHAFVPNRIEVVAPTLRVSLCKRNNCTDKDCGSTDPRPIMNSPPITILGKPRQAPK